MKYPSKVEIKNTSSCGSSPPYIFVVCCLIKNKDLYCANIYKPVGKVGGFGNPRKIEYSFLKSKQACG